MATPAFNFTQAHLNLFDECNVDVFIDNVPAFVGQAVSNGAMVRAQCRSGYKFHLVPDLHDANLIPSFYISYDSRWGDVWYMTGELEGDETLLEFPVTNISDSSARFSSVFCETEQAAGELIGNNKVYLVNNDNLDVISLERYETITEVGEGVNERVFDYGQFIISLIKIPFEIPAEIIAEPENITLANKTLTTVAPLITKEVLTVNLGSITVPNESNNATDYIDTIAVLHLPYAPPLELDLEYVIGETLSIQYLVDLYSGNATINIYSERLDSVISSRVVNLGVNVPYGSTVETPIMTNSNIEIGGDNGVNTPFIELIRGNFELLDNKYTIPVEDYGKLPVGGYVQVLNVELSSETATHTEKSEIIHLLENGVLINE